jgi:hypothetical protein
LVKSGTAIMVSRSDSGELLKVYLSEEAAAACYKMGFDLQKVEQPKRKEKRKQAPERYTVPLEQLEAQLGKRVVKHLLQKAAIWVPGDDEKYVPVGGAGLMEVDFSRPNSYTASKKAGLGSLAATEADEDLVVIGNKHQNLAKQKLVLGWEKFYAGRPTDADGWHEL